MAAPSFIVLDLAVDGYFLPAGAVETEQHLLDFLNGVVNGSAEVSVSQSLEGAGASAGDRYLCFTPQRLGGNGVAQRLRRLIYDMRSALTVRPAGAPRSRYPPPRH